MKILADRGDEQEIIEEEKLEWLHRVLKALGVHESVLDPNHNAIDGRSYIEGLDLEVWNHFDGTLDITRRGKMVAQWKKPELVLIKESQGKWYYEIRLKEWALPFQMNKKGIR